MEIAALWIRAQKELGMIASGMKEKVIHFILITLFLGFLALVSAVMVFQRSKGVYPTGSLLLFFLENLKGISSSC